MAEFVNEEKFVNKFKKLCLSRGYKPFRMSKFEEYELYLKNKDFLVSDNIISFTDTDGRLMAMKPDVTLSIIKNSDSASNGLNKLFYNESVYRISKRTKSFKEITQVGLEAIGEVDEYVIFEVLLLALKSLSLISDKFVIDISELDIVKKIIDYIDTDKTDRNKIIKCISDKNNFEINKFIGGCSPDVKEILNCLINSDKNPLVTINNLRAFPSSSIFKEELNRLERIVKALSEQGYENNISVDFSVINNMKYYNGIAFNGFISGIPESVLSGGSYDGLMKKMKKAQKAIGFAVYLDELEALEHRKNKTDNDIVIYYKEDVPISLINEAVLSLSDNGNSVTALRLNENAEKGTDTYVLTRNGIKKYE